MTRASLFALFFVTYAGKTLGFDLSVAPGLSVKNAFLYLIILALLIEIAIVRNRRVDLLSVVIPFAVFVMYAVLSWLTVVLIIDYPGYSVGSTLIKLKSGLADHFLTFAVFFYGVTEARQARKLLASMIWVIVLGNLVTVIDALNIPDLGLIEQREDGRVSGPFSGSNEYAAMIVFFLPATVALYRNTHGMRRSAAIAGVFVTILALAMTVSRGAVLALFCGLLYGAIVLRRYIPMTLAIRGTGLLFVVLAISAVVLSVTDFGTLIYERFVGTGGSADSITSGRSFIWSNALERMASSPISFLTGFGWDAYSQTTRSYATHNYYLFIFYNLGAIGLFLYIGLAGRILYVVQRAIRQLEIEDFRYSVAFVVGYFGLLIAMMFSELLAEWVYVWAYTGVILRLVVASWNASESDTEDKMIS